MPGNRLLCWEMKVGLGSGTPPFDEPGLESVTSVAVGQTHTCAVSAGKVFCWGLNDYGQLGDGSKEEPRNSVRGIPVDASYVTARGRATCAVTTAGKVSCWGIGLEPHCGARRCRERRQGRDR